MHVVDCMLHTQSFRTMFLAAFALLCGAACSEATPITLPPGLAPGTEYRILFVTSTTQQATSDDISTYNAFDPNSPSLQNQTPLPEIDSDP